MKADPTAPQTLMDLLADFVKRADEDRRAAFVLSISALSILVDHGICTTEQAVARIDWAQNSLPERLRTARLEQHLALAREWLRLSEKGEEGGPGEPLKPRWTPEVIAGGLEAEGGAPRSEE